MVCRHFCSLYRLVRLRCIIKSAKLKYTTEFNFNSNRIAMVAYVIFWMVVVIGYTFGIPEPIMGFTLLAFGGILYK